MQYKGRPSEINLAKMRAKHSRNIFTFKNKFCVVAEL